MVPADGALVTLGVLMWLVGCGCAIQRNDEEPCPSDSAQLGGAARGGGGGGGVGAQSSDLDKVYGLLSCVAAVLLYGTNYVPVKRVDTGDGMFFQWISCAAIWGVALIGNILLDSSKAHPTAMLGGIIWATGNITSVPAIKCIGLGLAMLLWGSTGFLIGWVSSRFGLFGVEPEEVPRPLLNDCGAGLCLFSAVLFFFVRTDVQKPSSFERTPILIEERSFSDAPRSSDSWVDMMSPKTKRPFGCVMGLLSGLLFGSSLLLLIYMKHHGRFNESVFTGSSENDVNYWFPQSSSMFLTSTVYFIIYSAVMRNRPRVYPRAILSGFLTGGMWGVATYCLLYANHLLGPVVTFPSVMSGCGLVAALWGSLVFKEVKSLGNILLFALASCVMLAGILLIAFSKL